MATNIKRELFFLKGQRGLKYYFMRYFYKWLYTPKSDPKFAFKVLSANLYFYLGRKQLEFISWITRYYPFSLLWSEKLYHAKNLKVRDFMDEIQAVAKKSGLNIMLFSGGTYTDYCEMEGNFTKKVNNKNNALKKLESCLQETYKNIYVRSLDNGFKLILPNDLIQS